MSLSVIVTRTLPGARDTADELQRLGYAPIVSPMLEIVETGFEAAGLGGVRQLAFTSANGVRAARKFAPAPGVTVWCVGPSTAEAARTAGFADVVEGDGNADDLARLILASRIEGPLLHIVNQAAGGELVAALNAGGLKARTSTPYTTIPSASFNPEARAALAGPRPAILLLHSARAAAAVAACQTDFANIAATAISEAALKPLKGLAGKGDWIAVRPNEDSLMDALSRAAAALCP